MLYSKTDFVLKKILISIKKTIESTLIDMEVNNRILKCSWSRILEELEPATTKTNSRNLYWLNHPI